MPTQECNNLTLQYAGCISKYMSKGEHLLGKVPSVNTVRFSHCLVNKEEQLQMAYFLCCPVKGGISLVILSHQPPARLSGASLPSKPLLHGLPLVPVQCRWGILVQMLSAVHLSSAAQALPGLHFPQCFGNEKATWFTFAAPAPPEGRVWPAHRFLPTRSLAGPPLLPHHVSHSIKASFSLFLPVC